MNKDSSSCNSTEVAPIVKVTTPVVSVLAQQYDD